VISIRTPQSQRLLITKSAGSDANSFRKISSPRRKIFDAKFASYQSAKHYPRASRSRLSAASAHPQFAFCNLHFSMFNLQLTHHPDYRQIKRPTLQSNLPPSTRSLPAAAGLPPWPGNPNNPAVRAKKPAIPRPPTAIPSPRRFSLPPSPSLVNWSYCGGIVARPSPAAAALGSAPHGTERISAAKHGLAAAPAVAAWPPQSLPPACRITRFRPFPRGSRTPSTCPQGNRRISACSVPGH
jgi:hypothetical protein